MGRGGTFPCPSNPFTSDEAADVEPEKGGGSLRSVGGIREGICTELLLERSGMGLCSEEVEVEVG